MTCLLIWIAHMNFKKNESSQKLRGGYYTPADLAEFLVRWVRDIQPSSILEPSCGDGVFFSALSEVGGFEESIVTSFELDADEAKKAHSRSLDTSIKASVHVRDFLGWSLENLGSGGERFDAVIGNPPFVRYQYLPSEFQEYAARVFQELDCKFTKHTNAWVPFILASISLLRPGGRLAMVVPSEIIHVTHAQSLRTFLGEECRRLVVIDPQEIWFENTLQGAVILLAEKKRDRHDLSEGLGLYPVKNREFLNDHPAKVFAAPKAINGKTVEGKWTRAFLDAETRNLLDELANHDDVHRFSDIASVDVGIVTGANKFFLVNDETVAEHQLNEWAHPMFGKSEHCPGIIYDKAQHKANSSQGKPTNFLWFKDSSVEANKSASAYIEQGTQEDLHTRYKCRIRSPWYSVPSVYSTEVGMLKRSHHAPRLILNKVGAYTTDTAYRIRSFTTPAKTLVTNFINPLTALCAELEGRYYGGGVLELVPSEIERLLIPIPEGVNHDLKSLDKAIRTRPISEVLETQGRDILKGLGLAKNKQSLLLNGWNKMRNRRQRVDDKSAPA
jgi:adenine-specific DNA-methyltransferase